MALAADIESREWRRKYLESNGLPEEHPRASNTDDIECFFSILRESVGKDFTLKEVSLLLCTHNAVIFINYRCFMDGERLLANL